MPADTTPVICYYHAECMDGFTSAWIIKHLHPDAELIAVYHGDEVPALPTDSLVYLVDFTFYDVDFMLMLADNNVQLIHFDHHEGAEETIDYLRARCNEQHYRVAFDKTRSGAGITWDELHPTKDRPHLVNFVEDRDLWLFNYPETRFFTEALASLEKTVEAWDWAHRRDNAEWLLEKGETLYNERIERCLAQIETTAKPMVIEFEGEEYPALASFLADPMDNSEQADLIVNRTEYPIALAIWIKENGDWKVRVGTSDDGPNANRLAKTFSEQGGGHPNAAGFVIKEKDLQELL